MENNDARALSFPAGARYESHRIMDTYDLPTPSDIRDLTGCDHGSVKAKKYFEESTFEQRAQEILKNSRCAVHYERLTYTESPTIICVNSCAISAPRF